MNITRPSHQCYKQAVEQANNAKNLTDGKLAGAKFTGYNNYLADKRDTTISVNNIPKSESHEL